MSKKKSHPSTKRVNKPANRPPKQRPGQVPILSRRPPRQPGR